jgi:hypothetical protein
MQKKITLIHGWIYLIGNTIKNCKTLKINDLRDFEF